MTQSPNSVAVTDGIRVEVISDEMATDEDEIERVKKTAGVRELLNRFATSSDMDDVSERVYTMGLLYPGGCGFRLCPTPKDERLKGQSAVDLIDVESVAPWELTYDRRARNMRKMRYWGYFRQESIERAQELWSIPEGEELSPLRDVAGDGFRRGPRGSGSRSRGGCRGGPGDCRCRALPGGSARRPEPSR